MTMCVRHLQVIVKSKVTNELGGFLKNHLAGVGLVSCSRFEAKKV